MRTLLYLGLLWPFIIKTHAQTIEQYLPKTGLKVGYVGAIIYPGFSLGVERPYKVIEVNKSRFKKPLTLYRERYYGFSISMYHHKAFHTNLYLQAELTNRRQYSKGLYVDASLGAGLSRTILAGATYEVSENGDVRKVPFAGKSYGLISANAAIGYNLGMQKNHLPLNIYFRPGALLIFPYNNLVLPSPTIEIGAIYRLNGFWEKAPKYVVKGKK